MGASTERSRRWTVAVFVRGPAVLVSGPPQSAASFFEKNTAPPWGWLP
jgi:hypothetical protein